MYSSHDDRKLTHTEYNATTHMIYNAADAAILFVTHPCNYERHI